MNKKRLALLLALLLACITLAGCQNTQNQNAQSTATEVPSVAATEAPAAADIAAPENGEPLITTRIFPRCGHPEARRKPMNTEPFSGLPSTESTSLM